MFKLLFTLTLLVLTINSQAQIISIPDAMFKRTLIQKGVDENEDGEIQIEEAKYIRSLDVSSSGITSLEGIEFFTGLVKLNCFNNYITTINLSKCPSLLELNINS